MEVIDVQVGRDRWFSRRRRLAWRMTRGLRSISAVDRVHLDDYEYPHYAYGILTSCLQARMLGHHAITVIEFGVAGGRGLLAMQTAANQIGPALSIDVDVIGIDGGEGLPDSTDVRDVTYWFRPGAFAMDEPSLRARLLTSQLLLGPVEELMDGLHQVVRAPVGFCALDLDYFSSSSAALKLFEAPQDTRLPRVLVYADDIFGWHDLNIMCTAVGEERAFTEFNETHDSKILPVRGLRHKRPIPAMWNEKMFCHHDFEHFDYSRPVNPLSVDANRGLLSL